MTKEDEIPDWAGAQDFYEKYDPKEILGRYCHIVQYCFSEDQKMFRSYFTPIYVIFYFIFHSNDLLICFGFFPFISKYFLNVG